MYQFFLFDSCLLRWWFAPMLVVLRIVCDWVYLLSSVKSRYRIRICLIQSITCPFVSCWFFIFSVLDRNQSCNNHCVSRTSLYMDFKLDVGRILSISFNPLFCSFEIFFVVDCFSFTSAHKIFKYNKLFLLLFDLNPKLAFSRCVMVTVSKCPVEIVLLGLFLAIWLMNPLRMPALLPKTRNLTFPSR